MFINRTNQNSKFSGTIIKYDDSISSISLEGNVSMTPKNDEEQLKDILIINVNKEDYKIEDWENKCEVGKIDSNNNKNYLQITDKITGKISINASSNDSLIHYFRACNGFIEYNNYGNVKIKGVGIFNGFNKILYLENGFLIRVVDLLIKINGKNEIKPKLIIKHPDFDNNIILLKDQTLYISDKIWLKKEDNTLLHSNEEIFGIGTDCFSLNSNIKKYDRTRHQIITIYKDEQKIISFDFLSGHILYYLNGGNNGFIKIISRENFEPIPKTAMQ